MPKSTRVLLLVVSIVLVGCSSSNELSRTEPCEDTPILAARLGEYEGMVTTASEAVQRDPMDRSAQREAARWRQRVRDTQRELDEARDACADAQEE